MATKEEKLTFVRSKLFPGFEGYMVEDIKSLLAIDKTPGRTGACNFPIALYVLSCMEYLGYVTSVGEIKTNDRGYTQKRIRAYADAFFPEPDRSTMCGLWGDVTNIFRHGLSHVYFPKQGGVSRADSGHILNQLPSGDQVLDADSLAKIFMVSISELANALRDDDVLCERMFDRQEKLAHEHSSMQTFKETTSAPVQDDGWSGPPPMEA